MEADHKLKLLFLCLLMTITIPALKANIGDFDEEWEADRKKPKSLRKRPTKPEPLHITTHLNRQVHRLQNPIDACWRCDPNWDQDRQKLADCALGFGHETTGGKGGRIYTVTDPSDDNVLEPDEGTLRWAVIQPEPLWIIFKDDMKIELKEELMVTSNKTIDARGCNVHIEGGAQITLQYVQNIIICNLHVRDTVSKEGGMVRGLDGSLWTTYSQRW
ncbi:hypothetical protein J5N97_000238 [Dioscorea zingiberensis]|uniref:Pectate lyase n=1 Tax=Dioscorea zingiberensis TaxID=325984 RepID=A0A9D5BSM3_9LILI|nr:hypothetical protein J5N97_000238 [Dioscorea zingiberensis]